MSDAIIQVENLGKKYIIGHQVERNARYTALRDVIANGAKSFLKSFQKPKAESQNTREEFWALKDVSFEVKQGETIGIIGSNGAGKSTLLKVLSRITEPTTGEIRIRGRVASLLEVGTGFHPELTGRENIYLNGAILGMSRAEIRRKFDEIVAFAEVERFLDTPVKHYSSGMYVRLAFAVAAHLEPEILIVDEVLAVGDAAFQKKCLGKMEHVSEKEGRTVFFVSHNMALINQLCSKTILLESGRNILNGITEEVVNKYLLSMSESGGEKFWNNFNSAPGNDSIRLKSVRALSNGETTGEFDIDKEIKIEVEFWNFVKGIKNLYVDVYLLDNTGRVVLSTPSTPKANLLPEQWCHQPHPQGIYKATCTIPKNFLNNIVYYINVYIVTLGPMTIHVQAEQILSFTVVDTGTMIDAGSGNYWAGVVRVRLPWQTEFLESVGIDR